MKYSKPEIAVLGDANLVIQGPKDTPSEVTNVDINQPSAFELED